MNLWPIFKKAGIIGYKGEKYKVGPTCAVIGCPKFADHAHHVFSRALMAGDFNWIRLHDGTDIGNLIPICHTHHDELTENKARIWIDDPEYTMYWDDMDPFSKNQPLKWQPPKIKKEEQPEKPVASAELLAELGVSQKIRHPGNPEHFGEHLNDGTLKVPRCESCGRPWRKRRDYNNNPEEKKLRGTFGISIPIEERENGFEVLEDLIESCRGKLEEYGLEWGHGYKNRYHLVCTVLGLFSLHADSIMNND